MLDWLIEGDRVDCIDWPSVRSYAMFEEEERMKKSEWCVLSVCFELQGSRMKKVSKKSQIQSTKIK